MRGAVNTGNDRQIGRIKRFNEGLLEYPTAAGLRAWLENSPDGRVTITVTDSTECLLNRGRMMCEIVVNSDTVHLATDLEPALDAFERRECTLDHFVRDFQFLRNADRTESVLNIEGSRQRNFETS